MGRMGIIIYSLLPYFLDGDFINKLYLVSEIPPSVNHYLAYRAIIKNGKPVAISYKTTEANKYQKNFIKYVKQEIKKQEWSLIPNSVQHFYVDAIFYFPRTDMDANNYWKVLLDAITDTKSIWLDDNVTCERVQGIYYDSDNPRIELVISPVEYIGIFENKSQLENFKSNCIGCNRYKRNCSILRNAINGKIQSEINNYNCKKFKAIKIKE